MFGKNYRSHHSCRKDESIILARWHQCALFSSLIGTNITTQYLRYRYNNVLYSQKY